MTEKWLKNILDDSRKDLYDDFNELSYLYFSYLEKVNEFRKRLKKVEKYIYPSSFKIADSQTNFFLKELQKNIIEVKKNKKELTEISLNEKNIQKFIFQKKELFDLLRTQIGLIGSLITSLDWQSPSYSHSLRPQNGTQNNLIEATVNDYKRDRHLDEETYQKKFIKEYIDGIIKLPVNSYLVNSGMAAFTTILTFLFQNLKDPKVLSGKSIYFENKELLRRFFKKIYEVDESNTEEIIKFISVKKPEILIFDSLCNNSKISCPDIEKILKYCVKNAKKETYFLIDNTILSINLQPLKYLLFKNSKVKLIVFESLNKYHQFGLDKITAGIIWVFGGGTSEIISSRVHSGTNITDSSCYILPKPNRQYLHQRMQRISRNNEIIAKGIYKYLIEKSSKKISGVVFPSLPNHSSFSWTQNFTFKGSFFVIVFNDEHKNTKTYQSFIKQVLSRAKENNVNIVAGTSFGFNTTRIYLTALNSDYGIPFIRVSVGTECALEIEKITKVFLDVIESF